MATNEKQIESLAKELGISIGGMLFNLLVYIVEDPRHVSPELKKALVDLEPDDWQDALETIEDDIQARRARDVV